jgi:hypothetical protein
MKTAFVRGILSIFAACSGLLLIFGLIYAMEGMTTRLPTSELRELATASVFMLPLTLLFCSGLHDLASASKRDWLFWAGTVFLIVSLYYFSRNTSLAGLTKTIMPLVACLGAALPHVFHRISGIYTAVSVLFALCGVYVLYFVGQTIFTPGRSFATPAIACSILIFALATIAAGVLAISRRFHRSRPTIS